MRVLMLFCLVSLAGCINSDRREGFTTTGPYSFVYIARTTH